jgi:hypothetical protein
MRGFRFSETWASGVFVLSSAACSAPVALDEGDSSTAPPENVNISSSQQALTAEFENITCGVLPAAPQGRLCRTTAGTTGTVVLRGAVLAPNAVYRGGSVRIEGGVVQCVGCNCDIPSGATVLTCRDGVISPGLINTHDHMTYAHTGPVSGEARYDHRHEWRLGLNGQPVLRYDTQISCATTACPLPGDVCVENTCRRPPDSAATWQQQLARELGFITTGTTSVVTGNAFGLARNIGNTQYTEGLSTFVGNQTFPLGDAEGQLHQGQSCASLPGPNHRHVHDAYMGHVAEGISAVAQQEAECLIGSPYPIARDNSTFVHAVGLTAWDAARLAEGRTWVSWSPRSNISLYGTTADVRLLDTLGVGIVLGTDWVTTGSISLQRELACAAEHSQRLGGVFSDFRLWEMVTTNAALSLGLERHLGTLRKHTLADVALYWKNDHADHRAVIQATARDVALVLRGGKPLYGDAGLMTALGVTGSTRPDCAAYTACGDASRPKTLCSERNAPAASLLASVSYDVITCGVPAGEPTCTPQRTTGPDTYDCANPTALDPDCDGVPDDGTDNCPGVFNPRRPFDGAGQADFDGDSIGDTCDPSPVSGVAPRDPRDHDGDGVVNAADNCPRDGNLTQEDTDTDGRGDACAVRAARDPNDLLHARSLAEGVHVSDMLITAITEMEPNVAVMSLQRWSARPFSGILLYGDPAGLSVNNVVSVSGQVVDFYGTAVLVPEGPITVTGHVPFGASQIVVRLDNPSHLAQNGATHFSAEAYEGMLVRVDNVEVSIENPHAPYDFDQFVVSRPGFSDDLYVGNILYPALDNTFPVGTTFTKLAGVLMDINGYVLQPRTAFDVDVAP